MSSHERVLRIERWLRSRVGPDLIYASLAASVVFFPVFALPWLGGLYTYQVLPFLLSVPPSFLTWLGFHLAFQRGGEKPLRSALVALPLGILVFGTGWLVGSTRPGALVFVGALLGPVLCAALMCHFLVRTFLPASSRVERLLAAAMVYLVASLVLVPVIPVSNVALAVTPWMLLQTAPPLAALLALGLVRSLRGGWRPWRRVSLSLGSYALLTPLLLALGLPQVSKGLWPSFALLWPFVLWVFLFPPP